MLQMSGHCDWFHFWAVVLVLCKRTHWKYYGEHQQARLPCLPYFSFCLQVPALTIIVKRHKTFLLQLAVHHGALLPKKKKKEERMKTLRYYSFLPFGDVLFLFSLRIWYTYKMYFASYIFCSVPEKLLSNPLHCSFFNSIFPFITYWIQPMLSICA